MVNRDADGGDRIRNESYDRVCEKNKRTETTRRRIIKIPATEAIRTTLENWARTRSTTRTGQSIRQNGR